MSRHSMGLLAALSLVILVAATPGCGRKPRLSREGGTSSFPGDKYAQYAFVTDDGNLKVAVFRVWKAPGHLAGERHRCWEEVRKMNIGDSLRVLLCIEAGGTVDLELSDGQLEELRAFLRRQNAEGALLTWSNV